MLPLSAPCAMQELKLQLSAVGGSSKTRHRETEILNNAIVIIVEYAAETLTTRLSMRYGPGSPRLD